MRTTQNGIPYINFRKMSFPKMKTLATLNGIIDKNGISPKTLAAYGLHDLYKQGFHYEPLMLIPDERHNHLPEILFEDDNDKFCSVFSESEELSFQTHPTQLDHQPTTKLHSEATILSSEFDQERSEAILTSDL